MNSSEGGDIVNKNYYIDRVHKRIIYTDQEFQHHGVEGQKWGIITRNVGVNYVPIKERSNVERNEVSQLMSQGKYDEAVGFVRQAHHNSMMLNTYYLSSNRYPLTQAYGAVRTGHLLYDTYKASHNIKKDNERRDSTPVDPKTGFHLRTDNKSPEEDMKNIIPARTNTTKHDNNSVSTSLTFEMRLRGYDVRAKVFPSFIKGYDANMSKAFINPSTHRPYKTEMKSEDYKLATKGINTKCAEKTMTQMDKMPAGSRGILNIWFGGALKTGTALNYEITNKGSFKFYDSNNVKVLTMDQVSKCLNKGFKTEIIRTDNAQFNLSAMKEAME